MADSGSTLRVFVEIDHPVAYIQRVGNVVVADTVDWVRVHEGNLEALLAKHTGPDDVPCGRKEAKVQTTGRSPYEVNLADYRRLLSKNVSIFQFVFENYEWLDEENSEPQTEGYETPEYPVVKKVPRGWVDVDTVCDLKDVDKSAVTRAIMDGKLTCVMQESPRKRFVRKDRRLERWQPNRQDNFLMRRRLKIMRDLFHSGVPVGASEKQLMEALRTVEIDRHRDIHTYDGPYQGFFHKMISDAPSGAEVWRARLSKLISRECR